MEHLQRNRFTTHPIHSSIKPLIPIDENEDDFVPYVKPTKKKIVASTTFIQRMPILKWAFWIGIVGVFLLYQGSHFLQTWAEEYDDYLEKSNFVDEDYKVCGKYSFLAGVCTDARIAASNGAFNPTILRFIESKYLFTIITFDSVYVKAIATTLALLSLWMLYCHYKQREQANRLNAKSRLLKSAVRSELSKK